MKQKQKTKQKKKKIIFKGLNNVQIFIDRKSQNIQKKKKEENFIN